MTALQETTGTESGLLTRAGAWLSLGGAALGALGLLGWITGTGGLTTILPGLPPMMPITAWALVLIGLAGALRRRDDRVTPRNVVALLAALVVLAIGVGTIADYGLAVELQIDRLFASFSGTVVPARSSLPSALSLTFLASAILIFNVGTGARLRPSELLVLCAALTAFTGLAGIILGAPMLYRSIRTPIIGISLPSALSLLVTSMGVLLRQPQVGIMRIATSPGPGGILLRRLGLLAIALPVALGFVVTQFTATQRIEEVSVPVAILAVAMAALSLFLLGVTAPLLNRAHTDLHTSRAQSRSLVEQAPDGIFVADLDGRYTEVNEAGCRLLAYTREEIVGKTIIDLIASDDIERLWQSREVLLQGAVHVAEWSLRRRDGSYVPVEVSAKILPDGRWQGFVRDISERKRLEAKLRFAEAKSSGILSIAADAIISIDEEHHIAQFNEGAEKIFGYSKTEAIGAPLDLLIPERVRAAHGSHVAGFTASPEAARKMGTRQSVIVGRRKNGEEFPADAAISKLEVGGTRVLTVVIRDVTEQKRVENEQRFLADLGAALATTLDYEETGSRLAEVVANGVSDFCIVDLVDDDGEMRRLRAVSRDPSRTLICNALEQVPLGAKHPPAIQSAVESRQPVVVQHPSFQDVAAPARSADQIEALRAVNLHSLMILPLIAHGRLLGTISFLFATPCPQDAGENLRLAQDIAHRAVLALDNARLYRAAQRAIKARDEVLGIVAHDLRNPLAMILMQARLLQRHGSQPERRSQDSGDAIRHAATRMDRLIQDLLDATRIEAGGLTIEPRRVNVAEVTSDAVRVEEPLASSMSLEIRLDLEQDLPDVWADRDRLFQVFENLIGNAIKFTPPGGSITVGAARQETDVLFWVKDTGVGIDIGDQPHVFDRFWQGRAKERGGAGLGLPIVKGIVEAHGGRVWVDGALGQGSTFRFMIPTTQRIESSPGDLVSEPQ
jgi:PAS domain S-box-containing protein